MKILLVDDEAIILNGLRKLIGGWEDFQLVGSADDGETALEWLQKAEILPDLIITDIFMKYVDGLELVEQVNRLYPGIRCAILSGHGEFHLAQKAIHLKVSRYIMKPVDRSDLFSILKEIQLEVQAEQSQREERLKKEQFAAETVQFVRDKLLTDLLEGRVFSEKQWQEFSFCLPFDIHEPFISGVIRLRGAELDLNQRNMLLKCVAVKDLFMETFLIDNKGFILIKDYHTLVFGLQWEAHGWGELKEFSSISESVLGLNLSLVHGQKEEVLWELPTVYTSLLEQLEMRKTESYVYPLEQERKLSLALRAGQHHRMTKETADFMQQLIIENIGRESILQGLYRMMESISTTMENMGVNCPPYPPVVQVPISLAIERMEKWLDACLIERNLLKSEDEMDRVDKVITYMQEHYGDKSISLQRLADLAALHPNHFTQSFRKQTGLSCMQFLARLRMKKAKELLDDSNLKISEIAERVGYENPLYFSSYFKKWVGLNPSEYKERLRSDA